MQGLQQALKKMVPHREKFLIAKNLNGKGLI